MSLSSLVDFVGVGGNDEDDFPLLRGREFVRSKRASAARGGGGGGEMACGDNCSGHGICVNGSCHCQVSSDLKVKVISFKKKSENCLCLNTIFL
jgi:hypothetical protein